MSNGSSHNPNWPPPAARVVATTLSAVTVVLALTGNTGMAAATATGAFVANGIDIATSGGGGGGTAPGGTPPAGAPPGP